MSSYFIPISTCPPLYRRQVLELWDYEWDPIRRSYERMSYRAIHMTQHEDNPLDLTHNVADFFSARSIPVSELPADVRERMLPRPLPPPPPPGVVPSGPPPQPPMQAPRRVPPPRPPPPNFQQLRQSSPAAIPESPESPDSSLPYSPTDTPTKRSPPSPPAWSPDRLACDHSVYVARQDHVFALPMDCPSFPSKTPPPPFSAANPPLQPAPEPRRRRAPPLPRPRCRGRGRGILRDLQPDGPYVRPSIPPEQSAFVRPPTFQRARNLFADFIPNLLPLIPPSPPPMVRMFPAAPRAPSPEPLSPSPSPEPFPPSRTPSPDIFQEIYSHTRHPVADRSHFTIVPSWGVKAEKEQRGECVVCYGNNRHLQVRCRVCGSKKVCYVCIVGIYQSINSCPTCRNRGEF